MKNTYKIFTLITSVLLVFSCFGCMPRMLPTTNHQLHKGGGGAKLHSVRLPGLVAQQQVMFGSNGETYELTHNTIDRSAYMPGVLLVVKKIRSLNQLVYGLEKIL